MLRITTSRVIFPTYSIYITLEYNFYATLPTKKKKVVQQWVDENEPAWLPTKPLPARPMAHQRPTRMRPKR